MLPTEAVRRHAVAVLERWLTPERSGEPLLICELQRDFEALLGALAAAGVAPLSDARAQMLALLAAALRYGHPESKVLTDLLLAADSLGELYDLAVVVRDNLREVADLISCESKGGSR